MNIRGMLPCIKGLYLMAYTMVDPSRPATGGLSYDALRRRPKALFVY